MSRSIPRSQTRANRPNFALRRAVALGAATVALFGVVKGGEAVVDHVKNANLEAKIQNSGDHIIADFNDGKYKGDPVVAVKIPEGDDASIVAAEITKKGKYPLITQSLITSETGNVVDSDERLILPTALVDPSKVEQVVK